MDSTDPNIAGEAETEQMELEALSEQVELTEKKQKIIKMMNKITDYSGGKQITESQRPAAFIRDPNQQDQKQSMYGINPYNTIASIRNIKEQKLKAQRKTLTAAHRSRNKGSSAAHTQSPYGLGQETRWGKQMIRKDLFTDDGRMNNSRWDGDSFQQNDWDFQNQSFDGRQVTPQWDKEPKSAASGRIFMRQSGDL